MVLSSSPYSLYTIQISKRSEKFIEKLSKNEQKLLISKIEDLLTDDFKLLDIKKLQGFRELYRVKVSNYRIVYRPVSKHKIIFVALIAHRKDIYNLIKNLSDLVQA